MKNPSQFKSFVFPDPPTKPELHWRDEFPFKNPLKERARRKRIKMHAKAEANWRQKMETWQNSLPEFFQKVMEHREGLCATNHTVHMMTWKHGVMLIGEKEEPIPEALKKIIDGIGVKPAGEEMPKNILELIEKMGGKVMAVGPIPSPSSEKPEEMQHRTPELGKFMRLMQDTASKLGPMGIVDTKSIGTNAVKEWVKGKNVEDMRRLKGLLEAELNLHRTKQCTVPGCDMEMIMVAAVEALSMESRLSIQ